MVFDIVFILLGSAMVFSLGFWRGQVLTDNKWVSSAINKTPVISEGMVFKVECIGGDE